MVALMGVPLDTGPPTGLPPGAKSIRCHNRDCCFFFGCNDRDGCYIGGPIGYRTAHGLNPALCFEWGFTRTFPGNQDVAVNKSLRSFLSNFGTF